MNSNTFTEHQLPSPSSRLPPQSGTYALILQLGSDQILQVGSLGKLDFQPGMYLYIGSALGAGGIRARVQRDLRSYERTSRHWHLDWLLPIATPREVWWCVGDDRLECAWANTLQRKGVECVRGFGTSDCPCYSHLFRLGSILRNPSQYTLYCPGHLQRETLLNFEEPAM